MALTIFIIIGGVFNCGFYVTINTRNIVRAFDEWHFHTVGVNSASLVHESNKQATVYYQFQLSTPWVGGPSWNGGLRARIDADQLVTYVK